MRGFKKEWNTVDNYNIDLYYHFNVDKLCMEKNIFSFILDKELHLEELKLKLNSCHDLLNILIEFIFYCHPFYSDYLHSLFY